MSGTISGPVRRTPGLAAVMPLTAADLALAGRVLPVPAAVRRLRA